MKPTASPAERRRGMEEPTALMVMPTDRREQTATELAMYGPHQWPNVRPLRRAEYDFWMRHVLPPGHSIIGVPEEWRPLPPAAGDGARG
jgi:hypothetical protein